MHTANQTIRPGLGDLERLSVEMATKPLVI